MNSAQNPANHFSRWFYCLFHEVYDKAHINNNYVGRTKRKWVLGAHIEPLRKDTFMEGPEFYLELRRASPESRCVVRCFNDQSDTGEGRGGEGRVVVAECFEIALCLDAVRRELCQSLRPIISTAQSRSTQGSTVSLCFP